MSLISSDAKWAVIQRAVRLSPEEARGTTKGKEYEAGFIAGATRQPTEEEIEAAAKSLNYLNALRANPKKIAPMNLDEVWNAGLGDKDLATEMVRFVINVIQRKATEE